MLHQFLESNKAEILALAEEKTVKLAGPLPSSADLKRGMPIFYENLIAFMKEPDKDSSEKNILTGAAEHGSELLRLNYSLSHVVHAYGAMCQSITELAQKKNASISSHEFNSLNMCLDLAIASAVSEFQYRSVQEIEDREVHHLGFLVHELRNALSSATVAFEMIGQGLVGVGGSTARVLGANLARMRILIDKSLSEVRIRADPKVHIESFFLAALLDQIFITAQVEARSKQQILTVDVDSEIEIQTDRQLLMSAIANLIQNAMKYSKESSHIWVRGKRVEDHVELEVEDQCGGIDDKVLGNIFKPFVSGTSDQTGLGLGLTIIQRAVTLLQGTVEVKNKPYSGCVFTIQIPMNLSPPKLRKTVSSEDSVQPLKNSKS